jgi:hypothetical protein
MKYVHDVQRKNLKPPSAPDRQKKLLGPSLGGNTRTTGWLIEHPRPTTHTIAANLKIAFSNFGARSGHASAVLATRTRRRNSLTPLATFQAGITESCRLRRRKPHLGCSR